MLYRRNLLSTTSIPPDSDGFRKVEKPSGRTSTITTSSTAGIRVGDIFTIAAHPKWWQRLLIRLRIRKPQPLDKFIVTETTTNTLTFHEDK